MKEPVTFGLPFPEAMLATDAAIVLRDATGAPTPVQTRVLDRWSDGSVRWLLVDLQADVGESGRGAYVLDVGSVDAVDVTRLVQTQVRGGEVSIETGVGSFRIASAGPLIVALDDDGRSRVAAARLTIEDGEGRGWPLRIDRAAVEESGPIRTVVKLDGAAVLGRRKLVEVAVRLHFFAGSATVRCVLTVRNARRARHPGGYWELGDAGSVLIRDVSLVVRLEAEGPVRAAASPEPGLALQEVAAPYELYQDSSGGESWQSAVHVNRYGEVPLQFRGYRIRSDQTESDGLRATPIVSIDDGVRQVCIAVPQFWQNFPKALTVAGSEIALGLFPHQHGDLHELQGGEQKTHTFIVSFGPDGVTRQPLEWCRAPLMARAAPSWYALARAMPRVTPANEDPSGAYLALLGAAVDGDSSFEAKREAIDEYGWRHFGDIYADHEAVGHTGSHLPASHYNNQYDAVAGLACSFFRTGDLRWLRLMQDLAAHVTDIDIYHTPDDKAAYSGGMFWHTVHYCDAGRSTHRSYPQGPSRSHGGGPSPEHCYATGLMLHHYLTGDSASRDAVVGLGGWILAADDGTRSPFRWMAGGATGLATASGSPVYHGPGRGGANAIAVLIDCHRMTGDRRFLLKAEALIRRCMHPRQDIDALNLGDVERRWFYTMFLQSVGKYLDHTEEGGLLDPMYSYARDCLLHFARWMAEHERPYLDRPEILEYPNETWAAQDMRKNEVFQLAALHATGDERRRFLERAEFFFQYAVSTLAGMSTRTLARPMVLLLSHGPSRAWFLRNASGLPEPAPAPSWPEEIWQRKRFVPQRVRATRNAMVLAGAGALGALVLLVTLFMR